MLNIALFGLTAKQWQNTNPDLDGNMRDYATIEQLLVLANIEGMNAELIHMGLTQGERLKRLNTIAIRQMQVLISASTIRQLKRSSCSTPLTTLHLHRSDKLELGNEKYLRNRVSLRCGFMPKQSRTSDCHGAYYRASQ